MNEAAQPRLLLGATLLAPGRGGIARVARMTARALIEAGQPLELVTFLDAEPVVVSDVAAKRARASRLAYLALCQVAGLRVTRAIYDSVGMARAHPRLGGGRIPYATWIHGIEVWHGLRPDRRRALEGSALVLCNSHYTLNKFQEIHGPLPNACVCWLATEDDDPPERAANFLGPPTVLCVGRIDTDQNYKGHRELIAAWPAVVDAVPEARLVLAGGGSGLEEIRTAAAASRVARSIVVAGFVPEEAMPKLWQQAHVFAMPSRKEGFGIVYAEAMRYGLPTVASLHDAAQETTVDGVTGYNVALDGSSELTERLVALLRDRDLARSMGAAGQARWREHFRRSAFNQRLRSCLQEFLSS